MRQLSIMILMMFGSQIYAQYNGCVVSVRKQFDCEGILKSTKRDTVGNCLFCGSIIKEYSYNCKDQLYEYVYRCAFRVDTSGYTYWEKYKYNENGDTSEITTKNYSTTIFLYDSLRRLVRKEKFCRNYRSEVHYTQFIKVYTYEYSKGRSGEPIVLCRETILNENSKKASRRIQYAVAIRQGDSIDIAMNNYEPLPFYITAWKLYPGESYPVEKIGHSEYANGTPWDNKLYYSLLASGDSCLKLNNKVEAKKIYERAKDLRPEMTYPRIMIMIVDQKFDQDKIAEMEYHSYLKTADVLFSRKEFVHAKAFYQYASEIRPDEAYPKDKIKECEINSAGK